MNILLHPTYFPSIATFATILGNQVVWEVEDNYQKQTYRNRCHICTDQGLQMLNIPIKHVGGTQGRQKYNSVKLDNEYAWQRQHWRTLQTAYRTSPFFEFYEDEISFLFEKPFKYLMDFNFKTIETIGRCIDITVPTAKTTMFHKTTEFLDARFLVNAKKDYKMNQRSYIQVFNQRHGFVENLSILDLLFNLGTDTLDYLENENLDFLNA